MPHVLQARDGRNHTVTDERDVFQLVAEYLGTDFRDWLEEWAAEYKAELQDELEETRGIAKETEKELDELKDHQRKVFTDVYEHAEKLMKICEKKDPDPAEISSIAEDIWFITQDEL